MVPNENKLTCATDQTFHLIYNKIICPTSNLLIRFQQKNVADYIRPRILELVVVVVVVLVGAGKHKGSKKWVTKKMTTQSNFMSIKTYN
jgi:hypothetical protein